MTKKKYTDETLNFSDKLFIENETSLEYTRLVKGLLKAAKDDIREGKHSTKDSTKHLEEFIDELFSEYEERFPTKTKQEIEERARLKEKQKTLVQEDLKATYNSFKNYLTEYAIWDVDNTNSEVIVKSIKNCIVSLVEPIANIINVFARLSGHDKDLIPAPKLDHLVDKSMAKVHLEDAGKPKEGERWEDKNSTFVEKVVRSRTASHNAKKK